MPTLAIVVYESGIPCLLVYIYTLQTQKLTRIHARSQQTYTYPPPHTHTHTHTHPCTSEEREWRRQSQSVQRHLPRPVDINTTILRGAPHKDQKYRALYEAEELIKQEMIVMMQHDLVHLPPAPTPQGGLQVTKATLSKTKQELEKKPKQDFTEDELQEVREICRI